MTINDQLVSQNLGNMDTYVARVLYHIPAKNTYAVYPLSNNPQQPDIKLAAGSSVGTQQVYACGDIVVVATDNNRRVSSAVTDFIINRIPYSPVSSSPSVTYLMSSPDNAVRMADPRQSSLIGRIYDSLRMMLGILPTRADGTNNKNLDALPNDVILNGGYENEIAVLKHGIVHRAGTQCAIEQDSLLNRIRLITDTWTTISPLHDNSYGIKGNSLLEACNTALTRQEGGYNYASPIAGILRPSFRDRTYAGDLVTGWLNVKGIPLGNWSTPVSVEKDHTEYSGKRTIVSAHGLELRKSFNISSPVQLQDEDGINTYTRDVRPEEFVLPEEETEDIERVLLDKSLNYTDINSTDDRTKYPRADVNPELWGVDRGVDSPVSHDVSKTVRGAEQSRQLTPINTQDMYPLPPEIRIKDPHTGREYVYYQAESCIRQDPDGSVVLSDGYGSEIRMQRGKIIISPATDLSLRPGRDMHAMVGRHAAIVAQKDVILHSSLEDVFIKSEKSMSILSGGNSGAGQFLLDIRNEEKAVIRSKYSMGISAATSLYLGNQPGTSDTAVSTDPDSFTVPTTGDVIIQGGNNLSLQGTTVSAVGSRLSLFGHTKNSNAASCFVLTPGAATIAASGLSINSNIFVSRLTDAITGTVGSTTITVQPSDRYSMRITGSVLAGGDLNANDIRCASIRAQKAGFSNASSKSGLRSTYRYVPNETVKTPISPALTEAFNIRTNNPYNNSYLLGSEFTYPSSEELGIESNAFVMPGMLWQSMLTGGGTWTEHTISGILKHESESMVYPGYDAWVNGRITGKGYTESNLYQDGQQGPEAGKGYVKNG